jgi:hypothetical protein
LNSEWVMWGAGPPPSSIRSSVCLGSRRGRVKGGRRPAQRTLDAPNQRVTLPSGREAAEAALPAMKTGARRRSAWHVGKLPTRNSKEPEVDSNDIRQEMTAHEMHYREQRVTKGSGLAITHRVIARPRRHSLGANKSSASRSHSGNYGSPHVETHVLNRGTRVLA